MPVRGTKTNVDRCSALSSQLDCIADVMPGLSGLYWVLTKSLLHSFFLITSQNTPKSDAKCRVTGCRHRMLINYSCRCHQLVGNKSGHECRLYYSMTDKPIDPLRLDIDLCTGQVRTNQAIVPQSPPKLDILSPIEHCHMVPDPANGQWRCDETACQLL